MANPTQNWERCGDRYYRKVKLYDAIFDEDLELENYVLAGAPYSGAIALYRDESKIQTYRASQASKPSIDIYSYSGTLIRRLNWDQGTIRGIGWSEDEKLLVVTEDGTVRVYDGLQGDFTQFSLGHGAEDFGVAGCRFWGSGFVALLTNNRLIAVTQYVEPRPRLLALPPDGEVHSWNIIPPAFALSRSVEVLLAINNTIYVVDTTEAEDRALEAGPFRHISVSPNGKFVGLYTEDAKVWVISSDFQARLSEYNSRAKTTPRDMQWCGNNSVVLAWEDEVHMVGPNGASLKYYYDGWVHLMPDVDGIRLITNDVCEFLQKVPDESEETFKLGSTAPASVLLDAVEQLEKRSPKADDNIQLIRSNLDEAIDMCVRAAGQEYDGHWQKQLLKAASFGKSVLDLYNSDEFVNMCETLRVLNAVRDYRLGMPLTYDQYLRLTPHKLIQRLINRHEYLLAIKLSEHLKLPTDKVYIHWASQKARHASGAEDSICATIVTRLSDKRGISYEKIAKAAYDEGRHELATLLLNNEPRAGRQVPLLLSMEQDSLALDKAIASGDTDLVFFVLLQLKTKLPLASFFRLLSTRPLASALVESSAASNDKSLLKDLYYQDDRLQSLSNLVLTEALHADSTPAKLDKLKQAGKTLAESKDPAATQHAKSIAEADRLLRVQETLSRELDADYTGLSLHRTLHQMIEAGYLKRAAKLQSDFHVPEKVFAWIRLRALVAARALADLDEISKTRKSPIGWEPYFNECLAAGSQRIAGKFVPKCTGLSAQQRAEMYVKCGLVVEAVKELGKAKDVQGLEGLRERVGGSEREAAVEIERFLGQLAGRR